MENISIIMPCYNEQSAIPSVIPRTISCLEELKNQKAISQYELIVVNDKSTDKSEELLNQFDQLKVINTNGKGRGYGKALKEGFSKATGEWVGFLDVDNSYRPEDIPLFLTEIKKGRVDFVMGQRPLTDKGMSFSRGFGNYLYVLLAKFFYKSDLNDVCSGYRFFHRKHIDDIVAIPEQGLDFSIYLTLKMITQREKAPLKAIPIQYDPRLGESKLSVLYDGFAFLRVLLFFKLRSWAGATKPSQVR